MIEWFSPSLFLSELIFTKTLSFLKTHKWFCLFILLNLLDVLTTIFLLSNNLGVEGNPFARSFLTFGYIGLVMMKAIGITVIIFLLTRFKYNPNLMAYPSVVIGLAVAWNISVVILS